MRQLLLVFIFVLFTCLHSISQVRLGNLIRNKASEIKVKALDKAADAWENMSKEYDESNFNYAILFVDNSALFEADEKGSAFASNLLLGSKMKEKGGRSTEDYAYTNLKNGEMLMAGNKPYLAEKSLLLSKVLYEEDGKKGTTNHAQAISDLGLLYQSTGRFTKARTFDQDALEIRQSGSNRGMIIVSINNLAVLEKETGLYIEAETDLLRALAMANEEKNELAVALIYNNLAMTYLDMNKMDDAEMNMNKCIAAAGAVLKDDASNYIKLQVNLANIYRFEKKYPQAEELYLKAIDKKEKKLGAHPDLAHLQKGLAQLYLDMGRTGEVENLLLSAYDIDKRKLGENNPATLSVQQELANFYRFNNQTDKALDLINTVVEKKKTIYGETHPNYLQSLEDLALAQWQHNDIGGAKSNFKMVIDNTLEYIHTFFNSLNENEKTLYWEKTNARLQRFYSFAGSNAATDPGLVPMLYDVVINTKGFLMNNSSKIRKIIYASTDEELKQAYTQWLETKENLNNAFQLSKEEITQENINLDSLKARSGELERILSQRSALFKESYNPAPITMESIRQLLKPNEAAIEIIELNEYANGFTGSGNYIALLLTTKGLNLIKLGDSKIIADAIGNSRRKIQKHIADDEDYAITWKPVDDQLKGITKVYLSVDGEYHQLSFYSLKDPDGKYLVDKYGILFTGNSRDIVSIRQNETIDEKPKTAFLVGNPLFGKNAGVPALPGTAEEIKGIERILSLAKIKVTALMDSAATEGNVKEIASPGILHIATHGYFLADLSRVKTEKVLGESVGAARENPLLRSGILLANCENVFDKKYHQTGNTENGVLTAYEAMSLNLDKTDLVILSACETGLGTIKQGEGVYGLQRAFLIAGANCIIMSLWKVDDAATRELMTFFYTNYAKTGDKSLAFLEAMKQLKTKYKEPYFWGGFVLLSK